MKEYFLKMKGVSKAPPRAGLFEIFLGLVGSALALVFIGWLHYSFVGTVGLPLLIAPFGASAVLVFGSFKSPFAQPRNVIGGHVVSALVGVSIYQFMGDFALLGIVTAVPLAIGLMHLTSTVHPPGGATAFLAVAGGSSVHSLGYSYVFTPCLLGSVMLVMVGLLVNNIPKEHRYPQFWT